MHALTPQLQLILERTQVPGYRQLFALGVIGRPSLRFAEQPRVTLRSQQVRACNLAFALIKSGALAPAARVAVIGGGIAGVTVAAALRQHGHAVTILERRPGLMPLQAGSTQRWLHPHLIDWPAAGSADENAGLPLLNWRAAPAGEVFHQLNTALSRFPLEVIPNVQTLDLIPHAAGWKLLFHNRSPDFDAVILAVGFGAERSVPDLALHSYWDADNLDRDPVAPAVRSTHCFISGTGDGGLIDFIRARLYRFDHADTFRAFLQAAADPELHQQLLHLDQAAGDDPGRLASGYESVRVPAAVDEFLRRWLHPQRSATLHGKQRFPYSPTASLLNRFLASRILRLDGPTGASRYEQRELVEPIRRDGAGFQVRVADAAARGQRYHARFDQVIIRHGTQSALALLPAPIATACQQLASQFPAEPDPTRTRAWTADFFGPEPAPLPEPPSRAREFSPTPPAPPGPVAAPATPPFELAGPPQVTRPTRPSLYRYLCEFFPSASELENFVIQYFPDVARQISAGMNFDRIANMLLTDRGGVWPRLDEVVTALRERYPEQAARAEHLLVAQ